MSPFKKNNTTLFLLIMGILPSCLVPAVWADGIEQPLLTITFDSPQWEELLHPLQKKMSASVKDATLCIPVGSMLRTEAFPCDPQCEYVVRLRAMCRGIQPGDPSWKVGRAMLVGYDSTGREICHSDLFLIQGNRDWKSYVGSFRFAQNVCSVRLHLGNEGKAGNIWFDDLEVLRKWKNAEDLIGDAGFEGTLGVDHWFFLQSGMDWDSLRIWDKNSKVEQDADHVVTDLHCLHLRGTATLVSKPFLYNGETLILSGWFRTKDVKKGKQGWCGAGIQLVGLNEDGKHVCHTDLCILYGSNPWRYCQIQTSFPAMVKKVQVWIRIFDGAKGEAWFDEIRLQRIASKYSRPPFNAQKAAVTISLDNPGTIINHKVWAGVDTCYMAWFLRDDVRSTLPLLQKAGFELIRVREFSNGLGLYQRDDAKGNPVYNWEKFDNIFDLLVKQYHFTPVVTIESTPPALARPGSPVGKHCNRVPPNDMKKWGRYVEDVLDHVIDRYGKDEVETWLWEVWNEPSSAYYYNGTPEEFLDLAEEVYRAVDRVERKRNVNLQMGLTSGGGYELNHKLLLRLKQIDKLDLVDHYSMHSYVGARNPLNLLNEEIDGMKALRRQFPQCKHIKLGCTEWNSNSMGGKPADVPWNATMVVKAVKIMLDAKLDCSTFFCLIDHPEIRNVEGFAGYLGMLTKHGIPKPVFHAFTFLNELKGGKRLKLTSSNDPIDGLAVVMPDGTIRVVLTSYDEDTSRQPYETNVTVTLSGDIKGRRYRCTRYWGADEKRGNTYAKWQELGKPPITDTKATPKLRKASQFGHLSPPKLECSKHGLSVSLTMPSPGIRFLEFQPRK